ncbi:NRDE family protein [Bernardetia sp. Wsw4-3y2]|uniref:NRDE family protein n=1 Tax=Bernardetia sp. Wsw4-3y2 TaxID=3127471 RepID=UPI0030D2D3A8
MCTLTFVPLENNNFLLTSSRDEQKTRKNSELPSFTKLNNKQILRPVDGDAGGSWIGITQTGRTLCLLNGAFQKHVRNTPYRKSRGIILMELLAMDSENEIENYNFDKIESFTLIWIEKKNNAVSLTEYRWVEEENKLYKKNVDTKYAYIWSSATLYTSEIAEKREEWFEEWTEFYLKKGQKIDTISQILWHFHVKGGEKQNATPREQILMQDPHGGTVSLTQIISYFNSKSTKDKLTMKHYNLNTLKSSFDEMLVK